MIYVECEYRPLLISRMEERKAKLKARMIKEQTTHKLRWILDSTVFFNGTDAMIYSTDYLV